MPTDKKYSPSIRDPESQFEREVKAISDKFNKKPILDGNLLLNIALSTHTTAVPHQLGRIFKGFIVVDRSSNLQVWRDTSVTTQMQTSISLIASGTGTVSLWVF